MNAVALTHRIELMPITTEGSEEEAAWVAWAAWALSAALSLFALGFLVASATAATPERAVPRGTAILLALAFATVGARIASRQPHKHVGWLLLVMGLGYAIQAFAEEQVLHAIYARGASLESEAVVLQAWSAAGHMVVLAGALVLLTFPDRRPRGAELALTLGLAATTAVLIVQAALLGGPAPHADGPFAALHALAQGLPLYRGLEVLRAVLLALAGLSLAIAAFRADGDRRQQMKWVVTAALLAALMYAASVLLGGPRVLELLMAPALLLVPVAIGMAMQRYHLYDIDVLLNRALVYGAASAVLGGVVFAIIGLVQRSFLSLTGASSEIALTVSTLVLVATFTPLKEALQRRLDARLVTTTREVMGLETLERSLRVELALRDRKRMWAHLLDAAIAELGVTGGYVDMRDEATNWRHSSGRTAAPERVRLSFTDPQGCVTTLVLGPRVNDAPYQEQHLGRLRTVAELLTELGGGPSPSQPVRSNGAPRDLAGSAAQSEGMGQE